MAPTPHRCQQFPAAHLLTVWHLTGVAVLSLSYLGCWQEIRYEPVKTPAAPQAAVTQHEDPAEVLPAPEGARESQPAATAEGLFGDAADLSAEIESEESFDPFGEKFESDSDEPSEEERIALGALDLSAEGNSPVLAQTALATWQMSSKWSMAAALQAKDRGWDIYGERLEEARYGAKLLGVSLPDLPDREEGTDRLTKNLAFLLETAGPRLASELSKQHGADHAALAELATKTHVLLLSYTPSSTRLEPVIASIRQAAEKSGLPESVWRELVDLLTARADFKQVKAAIYQLHKRAVAHLRGQN